MIFSSKGFGMFAIALFQSDSEYGMPWLMGDDFIVHFKRLGSRGFLDLFNHYVDVIHLRSYT